MAVRWGFDLQIDTRLLLVAAALSRLPRLAAGYLGGVETLPALYENAR
jgi:hypothetical protein